METSNSYISSLTSSNESRSLWAGSNKPLPYMVSCDAIFSTKDIFRTPPEFHRSFDVVISHEHDLALWKQWPLILDELIRLIKPGGILSVRYSQSRFFSTFHFKNLLFQALNNQFELLEESCWDDGTRILSLRLSEQRREFDRTWTFGVIYDGSKVDNLERFIQSVRSQKDISNYEILICGPENKSLIANDVRFIAFDERFKEHGWITEKKNLIVRNAKFENVCIVHNRYKLNENFISGFEKFGYDFDVVVPRQEDISGIRFPDWTTLGSDWKLTPPGLMKEWDFTPYIYVNGGLIVAKRSVLINTPWNSLLFWNQAEDVELSRRMASKGIFPRFNPYSTANVLEARPGYLSHFFKINYDSDSYVLPLDPSQLVTTYTCDGISYRLFEIGPLRKVLNFFYKKSRSLIVKVFWIAKPTYVKLRPIISRSRLITKLIQRIRMNLNI